MDVSDFLKAYEKQDKRYLGIAFSSNSPAQLKKIKEDLLRHLSPIEEWESPGTFSSPEVPVSRLQFCQSAFVNRHPQGLLINLPEEWMFDWSVLDRVAFWNMLSQTYGMNRVYVIFRGTPTSMQAVGNCFEPQDLGKSNVTVWKSKYEQ